MLLKNYSKRWSLLFNMKILIIQLGKIGDMILATPMLRAIKDKYPDAKIDIVAGRHNYSVIKNNPLIDNIIIHKKPPLYLLIDIFRLRRKTYDYLIDPKDHYSTESRLFAWIVKSKIKIGYNQKGKHIFDISIPGLLENKHLHYTLRHFQALRTLGIKMPATIPKPELYPSEDSEEYVKDIIRSMPDKPMITLNISASKYNKMLQPEKWISILKKVDFSGWNLVITCAPSEMKVAEHIVNKSRFPYLFKSRSMDDVISLIKHSELLVTPDTSLVHVASAFNIPMLGIYSGLNVQFEKFKPLMDNQTIIRANKGDTGILSVNEEDVIKKLSERLKDNI